MEGDGFAGIGLDFFIQSSLVPAEVASLDHLDLDPNLLKVLNGATQQGQQASQQRAPHPAVGSPASNVGLAAGQGLPPGADFTQSGAQQLGMDAEGGFNVAGRAGGRSGVFLYTCLPAAGLCWAPKGWGSLARPTPATSMTAYVIGSHFSSLQVTWPRHFVVM